MSESADELIEPEINHQVINLLMDGKKGIYKTVIQSIERELFHIVLSHFKGNRLRASQALGISRFTLRKKLRQLDEQEQTEERVGLAEAVRG